jgi:hypothetical protein
MDTYINVMDEPCREWENEETVVNVYRALARAIGAIRNGCELTVDFSSDGGFFIGGSLPPDVLQDLGRRLRDVRQSPKALPLFDGDPFDAASSFWDETLEPCGWLVSGGSLPPCRVATHAEIEVEVARRSVRAQPDDVAQG